MSFKQKFKVFIMQFCSPLIYILIAAGGISFYFKEYIDAIIIFVVIFINSIVGSIQEIRADEALDALKKMSSPHSIVKRIGKMMKILSSDVRVGDILILEEGGIISADADVIYSEGLQVDESSLTGESLRIEKNIDNCKVFESTIVVAGHGEAIVTKVGKDTEFGKISSAVKIKKELTPLQKKLNNLSKILGIGIIIICFLFFLINYLRGGNLLETLINSISLAVAVIPEGLTAVVTITLSIGVQKLVNVNTIVRHLPVVETLGSVTLVCSDKTGTITENKMVVEEVVSFSNDNNMLLLSMALCNTATKISGDPTEKALLNYVETKISLDEIYSKYIKKGEIPFTSEKKMMSITYINSGEEITFIKGAYEVIEERCNKIYYNGQIIEFSKTLKKMIYAKFLSLVNKALRVLAFSYKKGNDEVFLGFVGEKDPLKKGVKEAIEKLKDAGVKTIMITGDHFNTATAIGRELNIINDDSEVKLGKDINMIRDEDLSSISVFARVTPLDKMKIVARYKNINHVVAMTGDGVNDAPSLKEADVGIAMGEKGTEVAKSVADIILTDDNFETIAHAIETGRVIYDNIKKSILFLLSSNLAEVFIMILCLIFNYPIPLIAIHILWVNLISDSLPALALGSDKPSDDVMKQKPRKKESSIFSDGAWKTTIFYGLIISITTFIGFIILPFASAITNGANMTNLHTTMLNEFNNTEILTKSRTMAFIILSLSELFHMIGMSSKSMSLIRILKKKNYFMMIIIVISLILQVLVVQLPIANYVFKTTPLNLLEWFFVLLLSAIPIVIHELKL